MYLHSPVWLPPQKWFQCASVLVHRASVLVHPASVLVCPARAAFSFVGVSELPRGWACAVEHLELGWGEVPVRLVHTQRGCVCEIPMSLRHHGLDCEPTASPLIRDTTADDAEVKGKELILEPSAYEAGGAVDHRTT